MKRIALLVGLFLIVACGNGRSQTNEATSPAPGEEKVKNEGTYYTVSVAPAELAVNEKGNVILSLAPGTGYKWNDEYPAKFSLTAPADVTLAKDSFSFTKKEIEVSKAAAKLTVPLTVTKSGACELAVKGSFSVCNDTSCKIMRNETFAVTITGK